MLGSGRSPGGGNGNPLQYSCLGNPIDRGAQQAEVHGVIKESDTTQGLNNNNLLNDRGKKGELGMKNLKTSATPQLTRNSESLYYHGAVSLMRTFQDAQAEMIGGGGPFTQSQLQTVATFPHWFSVCQLSAKHTFMAVILYKLQLRVYIFGWKTE